MRRLIKTEACLAEGAAWLSQVEPRFATALVATGPLSLRPRPDGFGALFSAIVSQQLSVASAAAIWNRLQKANITAAENVRASSDEELRGVGLSRQKIRYARALADAQIDFDAMWQKDDAEIIAILTDVTGIGIWTAEIYAMFSLSRADIFAPGDLALQESARNLFQLSERPKARAFRQMAEVWSPWRSVAAQLLWAYYKVIKNSEGIA